MSKCPHPEKRFYIYRDAADDAARAMSAMFGVPMHSYGCRCGRLHIAKTVLRSPKKPTRSKEAKRRRRKNYRENKRRREQALNKPRYKFLYRAGGIYFWQNTKKVDSRIEEIYCNVEWFWGRCADYAQISGKVYRDR